MRFEGDIIISISENFPPYINEHSGNRSSVIKSYVALMYIIPMLISGMSGLTPPAVINNLLIWLEIIFGGLV